MMEDFEKIKARKRKQMRDLGMDSRILDLLPEDQVRDLKVTGYKKVKWRPGYQGKPWWELN